MKVASIDIGTNTVLLLIAEIDAEGSLLPLHHEQRFPRLGQDTGERKVIGIAAFDRISWILNEYKNLARQQKADVIIAAATSAVRDADNREEFLAYLRSAAGLEVEVLSGQEEALWSYAGAVSALPQIGLPALVLDIGGGSTEVSFHTPHSHNGGTELSCYSLQIGSVRLTERHFRHRPPLPAEIGTARETILEEFSQLQNPGFRQYQLVGVAGTVTTLACLEQRLPAFDVAKVSGYRMSRDVVAKWLKTLSLMGPEKIGELSSATEGRADILTAGTLILYEFMSHFDVSSVVTSERGLRYGLAIREWNRSRGRR